MRATLGDPTVPVRMADVARCATSANWREASRDPSVQGLVHLQIGVGAGSGWVRRRHQVPEPEVPDDIAHLPLDRNGPACTCGGRGCLDVMAGFNALVELAEPSGIQPTTGPQAMRSYCEELAQRAHAGDETARRAIDEIAARIAQAAAIVITVFRPSRFTIGGYPLLLGSRFRNAFLDAARPTVHNIDEIATATGLGDEASLIGAFLLGIAAVAEDPLRLDTALASTRFESENSRSATI